MDDSRSCSRSVIWQSLVAFSLLLCLMSCAHAPSDSKRGEQQNPELREAKPPELRNAQTRRVWIAPKIDGNKYEEGHYVYIIERPSEWLGSGD